LHRRKTALQKSDRLLGRLDQVEKQLQEWTNRSAKNARWFRRDPLGAMHAAGLDIEDDIMLELDLITKNIAKKLKR